MGKQINELDAITAAVVESDLLELEEDPAGTPKSVKVTVEDVRQLLDNEKVVFGTGDDAFIHYDGTNLVIDPKVVGSGVVSILGNILLEASCTSRSKSLRGETPYR